MQVTEVANDGLKRAYTILVPAADIAVVIDCRAGGSLSRDGSVTARVRVTMPGVSVPLIGSVAAWTWTAAHVEPVDPYGSRP